DFDAVVGIGWCAIFGFCRAWAILKNPLVMIVDRDRQSFFGMVLANAVQIKLASDFSGLGDADSRFVFLKLRGQFLVQNLFAQDDAVVAYVNSGTGDQLLDFGMRFAAK